MRAHSWAGHIGMDRLELECIYVEYRDGIKIEGDKVGMPCTHSTVI